MLVSILVLADFGNPIMIAGDFSVLATEAWMRVEGWGDVRGAAVLSSLLLIPSFLLFALWVGEGTAWLGQVTGRWGQKLGRARVVPTAVVYAAALACLVVPFPARYRPLRASHLGAGVLEPWRQTLKTGRMGERVGRALADVDFGAIVVCDWEQSTALWYHQQVEGLRPDVQIVYPLERLDEAAARGRPLYIARAHAGLADR